MTAIVEPQTVTDFWAAAGAKKWWQKDDAFDAEIRARFSDTLQAAQSGHLDHWQDTPDSTLALILVLDQFTRNLNRNSPDAYANDPKALATAKAAIQRGDDRHMRDDLRVFTYLPLMHSENIEDQRRCLAHMEATGLEGNIKAAREHLDIIERFGRFPHRNAVLGRKTTPEEQAFLDEGGFKG